MARTIADEIEDRVRSRLQERLVSAGIDQGRVSVEVLFWLPSGFIREYQALYMRALKLGDGDGGQKAGADEGQIKAKVKSADRGKDKGRGLAAHGGGKRYKTEWVVKDEEALEVKRRVDRALVRVIGRELDRLARETGGGGMGITAREAMEGMEKGMEKAGHAGRGAGMKARDFVGESQGDSPGVGRGDKEGVLVPLSARKGKAKKRCRDCGKIASDDWARCPYSHD